MSILDQFDEKHKKFSQTEPRGVWIKDVDKEIERLVASVRLLATKFPDQQIALPNFVQKFAEQKISISSKLQEVPKPDHK
jgi:hypothetical protein